MAPEDLRAVLAGRGPDGAALARGPAGRGRVPGYDPTFSAPKSVSRLHALGDPRLRYLYGVYADGLRALWKPE